MSVYGMRRVGGVSFGMTHRQHAVSKLRLHLVSVHRLGRENERVNGPCPRSTRWNWAPSSCWTARSPRTVRISCCSSILICRASARQFDAQDEAIAVS